VKLSNNNGTGTHSNLTNGTYFLAMDWKQRTYPKSAIANISPEGSYSAAVNDATTAPISRGVFNLYAMGGDNLDALRISPGSELTIFTVGGSTRLIAG